MNQHDLLDFPGMRLPNGARAGRLTEQELRDMAPQTLDHYVSALAFTRSQFLQELRAVALLNAERAMKAKGQMFGLRQTAKFYAGQIRQWRRFV